MTEAPIETKVETLNRIIFADNLEAVKASVEKFNRKASKLGFDLATLQVLEAEPKAIYVECGLGSRVIGYAPAVEVTLSFSTLKIEGYEFCGVIDFLSSGNVIRSIEEGSIPAEFGHTCSSRCDHCGHKRSRNQAIILKGEDGSFVQIGSSCAAKFIGISLSNALSFFEGACKALDEDEAFGVRESRYVYTREVLAYASLVGRVEGWVSATKARDEEGLEPSSWTVLRLLKKEEKALAYYKENGWALEAKDSEIATETVEFWNASEVSNSYTHNLKVLLNEPVIDQKHIGIVGSAVSSYLREMDKINKAKEKGTYDTFFGEAKKRYKNQTVTILSTRVFDGYYGARTMVRMDLNGVLLVWWASGYSDLEKGEKVTVAFTVKAHETYKEQAQTIVQRCSF